MIGRQPPHRNVRFWRKADIGEKLLNWTVAPREDSSL